MIEFKNPLIKVRCAECNETHLIPMEHVGTDKELRNVGFEYEHIFKGKLKCSYCKEKMKLLTTIWEFPKNYLNYHETTEKSCLVVDNITNDSFNITNS